MENEYYNSYEINIAHNGTHFFATSERSCVTKKKLIEVLKIFQLKFPKNEGYDIMVTGTVKYGRDLTKEFLKE